MFNLLNITNTITILIDILRVVESLIGKKLVIIDKEHFDDYPELSKINLLDALKSKREADK